MAKISFHIPHKSSNEQLYVSDAIERKSFLDYGIYHEKCLDFFAKTYDASALLTPSCTAALEMACLLLDIKTGDEVIMPSFTFSSTANAFLLRGAKIKFIDIDPRNLNLSIKDLENSITKKTKVICPVHYAGSSCDMDALMAIANTVKAKVVEDAAQAIGSKYKGKYLGTIGDLGTLSFHATKNIHCGEGGTLLLNDKKYLKRATILKDKGTNRESFRLGKVDKYSWVDIGSSYTINDFTAAFLFSQLEDMEEANRFKRNIFSKYWNELSQISLNKGVGIPPESFKVSSNGHIFYMIFQREQTRDEYINFMKEKDIEVYFHYTPLHNAKFFDSDYVLPNTERIAAGLVRLPVHTHLSDTDVNKIIAETYKFINLL